MSTVWTVQLPQALLPPSTPEFLLKIDDNFMFLIDDTHKLIIQDANNAGGYAVVWTVQNLGQ